MHGYHVLLPLLLLLLTATTGQRPPITHSTATSLTSITETSTALDTLLLFDASGSVHSFDRRTGEHHWSSSFGGALISSYSHASQRRRLVPLLGGGVIEVEFARHENNTENVSRNDQDHHHHSEEEEVELEDGSSSDGRSSTPLPLVRLNDKHHLQHTVRTPSQTITRLPLNVRGMVERSPLPMSTYDAKGVQQTTTVLGQTNTTMFALDLRSGHVGSYVCSDGRR